MIHKKCAACNATYAADVAFCPKDGRELSVVLSDMIGQKLGTHYTMVDELGKGGMGAIYKAHHALMDRYVAIKLLLNSTGTDSNCAARFLVEARAASILSHPNIVKIFEFDVTPDGLPYLIMEYLEGPTLQKLLESKKRLPIARALPIFIELCSALGHAHKRNVVHRDLKPSNIMLIADDDRSERAVLVDFGIAKLFSQQGMSDRRLTQTGEVIGSPLYMSPEQCMGRPVDAKSDIYSLGCVMYETFTGAPTMVGENFLSLIYAHLNDKPLPFTQVCADAPLPSELEAIVLKTLQKSADDRYNSMAELKQDLVSFLNRYLQQGSGENVAPADEGTTRIWSGAETDEGTTPIRSGAEIYEETMRIKSGAETGEEATPIKSDEETAEAAKVNALINRAGSGDAAAQHQLGYFYYAGLFVEQNYDLAMYWLKKASDNNSIAGSYWVGKLYQEGKGADANPEQALHYYRLAAELGDALCQTIVGEFYLGEKGVPQDFDLAYYWYKKAADQNHANGLESLGWLYANGKGVDLDFKKAAQYYLKAAQTGDVGAQINLAHKLMAGTCGFKKDEEEGATWYLSAAQKGSPEAKRMLAFCYKLGNGVPKDHLEAFRWMKEAAIESDTRAQYWLAYFYERGLDGLVPDLAMALKWYTKLALKKDKDSQYRLGCMCMDGRGMAKNMTQAVSWFLRAAEQGDEYAQYELALAYKNGTGLETDIDEYASWLEKAAKQGLPKAEYELGVHYEDDCKDLQQARKWYQKAANQGHQPAKTRLLQLGFHNEREN